MVNERWLVTALLCTASACASKSKPQAPTPEPPPTVLVAASTARTYDAIMREVSLGDEQYMKMTLAAAGWLRHIAPGKTIGFFQPDMAPTEFKNLVDEVTRVYAFRPVHPEDFRVTCSNPAPQMGTATLAEPTCKMGMADVIMQFNSTRIARDSGWVGGSVTQVPHGQTNAEQKAFCITIARHGTEWVAIRSFPTSTGRNCPR